VNRLALVLALVTALCVGLGMGFLGGVLLSRHMLLGGMHLHAGERFGGHGMRRGFRREPPPRAIVDHLRRRLDLAPAQVDSLRTVIERSRDDFAGVRDSLRARIERLLTPAQRDRWQRLVAERDAGRDGD